MKYNPSLIKEVTLDGQSLVFEEFIAAARFRAHVKADPAALERMRKSRELAEKIQKDLQWKKAVRKWQEEWDDTLTGEDESRPD